MQFPWQLHVEMGHASINHSVISAVTSHLWAHCSDRNGFAVYFNMAVIIWRALECFASVVHVDRPAPNPDLLR